MAFTPGERVRVSLSDGRTFEGLVLPGDGLVLKLDDGYNIGIDPGSVEEQEVLEQPSEAGVGDVAVPRKDDSLPLVRILHTGGTIASKVDYETGGVSNLIAPAELLALYPELQDVAHVEADFVANMSSDDMRFAHYNQLIDSVQQALEQDSGLKGVIITHGTDTLHYTAAALHYALRGVSVPVVLVGSQRSSDRGSSDAASNLQAAVRYCVSEERQPGVFVCMHEHSSDTDIAIIPGVHARKMHTSRRDAFRAVNSRPAARVSAEGVERVSDVPVASEFSPVRFDEDLRIGMLYAHPQMFADEVSSYEGFDGLVVLGTGLGHLPVTASDEATAEHDAIREALFSLDCPVVMASQCIHGRVNLQVYSPARKLQDAGVLGHGLALTPEALFAKLAFLLSTDQSPACIADDFGDLVERTTEGSYD